MQGVLKNKNKTRPFGAKQRKAKTDSKKGIYLALTVKATKETPNTTLRYRSVLFHYHERITLYIWTPVLGSSSVIPRFRSPCRPQHSFNAWYVISLFPKLRKKDHGWFRRLVLVTEYYMNSPHFFLFYLTLLFELY